MCKFIPRPGFLCLYLETTGSSQFTWVPGRTLFKLMSGLHKWSICQSCETLSALADLVFYFQGIFWQESPSQGKLGNSVIALFVMLSHLALCKALITRKGGIDQLIINSTLQKKHFCNRALSRKVKYKRGCRFCKHEWYLHMSEQTVHANSTNISHLLLFIPSLTPQSTEVLC